MFDDIDDGARVGVWTAIGIITLLLFGLLGGLGIRALHQHAAPVAAAAPAVDPDAELDVPLTGTLTGTLYFALGSADLPADAAAALGQAKAALDAAPGKKLVLSGFHDASGDPVKNAELAKARAKAVREALKTLGVDAARVGLRKPESTTGDGKPEEARRVEIRLVD
jgi:outer membrane protein OmpA-like peptidoglycan-associated protein